MREGSARASDGADSWHAALYPENLLVGIDLGSDREHRERRSDGQGH
jgi:hypothetical protein